MGGWLQSLCAGGALGAGLDSAARARSGREAAAAARHVLVRATLTVRPGAVHIESVRSAAGEYHTILWHSSTACILEMLMYY